MVDWKHTLPKLALLLIVSWSVMVVTHELGHVVGGWIVGAKLTSVDLAPWRLPYSLHSPDPHPQVTLWAGPVLGILLPSAIACLIRTGWARFIADFCLLANGCYIAISLIAGDALLDGPRLLHAGSPMAVLVLFSALTIIPGYIRFRDDCVSLLKPLSSGKTVDPT